MLLSHLGHGRFFSKHTLRHPTHVSTEIQLPASRLTWTRTPLPQHFDEITSLSLTPGIPPFPPRAAIYPPIRTLLIPSRSAIWRPTLCYPSVFFLAAIAPPRRPPPYLLPGVLWSLWLSLAIGVPPGKRPDVRLLLPVFPLANCDSRMSLFFVPSPRLGGNAAG